MINAEMSLLDVFGQKHFTKCFFQKEEQNSSDFGWHHFVSHKDLLNLLNLLNNSLLLPKGKLTIKVEVNILISESKQDREPSLKQMYKQEDKICPIFLSQPTSREKIPMSS